MGDTLDDFFAKKDKKKSKKPKFLTADELVKNLEETKREIVAKPTIATVSNNSSTNTNSSTNGAPEESSSSTEQAQTTHEEEWNEFEEEQRKDYTGLKIGQLTLNDEDEQSNPDEGEEGADSDGNITTDMKQGGGPWKKVVPAEEVTQIPMETVEKPSVYISPALRASQSVGPSRIKVRSRAAPDITNAEYFPSLGAARPEEQRKKKNEPAFEEVRHGSRVQRVQEQAPAPTAATNRFQSLDEDDS